MSEWKRIFSDRRRCAVMLCIPLLCLALFAYQRYESSFYTPLQEYRALIDQWKDSTPEEIIAAFSDRWSSTENERRLILQAEHILDYPAYLERVQEQAWKMQHTSIFGGDPNSFVYRNIVKTAEDFSHCSADGIRLGNDRAIRSWLSASLPDWGFLAAILLIVMSFQEERRKGLVAIIRSCPGGRGKLQGTRLLILLIYSAGMTLLLYYLPLAISLCLDGGWADLDRPVQSLVEFQKFTAQISISEFLAEFFFVKTACGFLLGILLWFLLSFLAQVQLCWILSAAGLAAEYLLYTFIPAQSIFSPLRYINVFSYVFTDELYTQYVNINFLTFPVGRRELLMVLLAVLSAALSAFIMFLLPRRHPYGNRDRLGRWIRLWNRIGDALRRPLGLYGFECYKLLFLTAGGLVLILGAMFSRDLPINSGAYNSIDDMVYRQYVAQVQGPVTQRTVDYIAQAKESLKTSQLNTGDFEKAIVRLEQSVAALDEGDWLVDEIPFMNLYGEKAWYTQRNTALTALLILTVALSALFAVEQGGDVRRVLRSAPGGRSRLFWTKYAVALSVTAAVWLMVFGQEWHSAVKILGETTLAAPCGSIPILKGMPGTVGSFLALLYLSKGAVLLIPMHMCVFFSERCGSFEKSFLLGGAALLLPAAMCRFGVDLLCPATPMTFLAEGNPLLCSGESGVILILWSAISLMALFSARRSWYKTA